MFPKSLHQKEISNENPISIFRILESRDFNSISIFEISFYPFVGCIMLTKAFRIINHFLWNFQAQSVQQIVWEITSIYWKLFNDLFSLSSTDKTEQYSFFNLMKHTCDNVTRFSYIQIKGNFCFLDFIVEFRFLWSFWWSRDIEILKTILTILSCKSSHRFFFNSLFNISPTFHSFFKNDI
jgi:hypothetical protein